MRKSLFFLIAISLFFNSCTKESEVSELIKIEAKDYGFYHNEAIRSYYDFYEKRTGKKSEASDILNEDMSVLISDMTLAMQEKYPDLFVGADLKVLNEVFSSYKKGRDYNFEAHWKEMTTQKRSKTTLEPELINLVNESISNNYDFETILNKLDNIDVDSKNKEVFKSVLVGSNNLWFGEKNRSYKGVCSQRTIIADTGTAALLVWNPLASIIGAGISSLITDASCSENIE